MWIEGMMSNGDTDQCLHRRRVGTFIVRFKSTTWKGYSGPGVVDFRGGTVLLFLTM